MVMQVIKTRHSKRLKVGHRSLACLGLLTSLLASLLVVGVAFAVVAGYLVVTKDLPSINSLPAMLEPPDGMLQKPTQFFDRAHQQVILTLENPGAEGRQYLYISEEGPAGGKKIAQTLVDATLVANDPSFWKEPGYTLKGIADGSHPTLAQQLVSDLLLDDIPASLLRNIQERVLAEEVTAQYGREKVLEWYLNSARYGEFVFGADAAARVYFGKSAEKLSIGEAAILTALATSPHLNPWPAGQLLRDSEVSIIQGMLQADVIDPDQAQEALMENVQFQPRQTIHSLAPTLTNLAILQISEQFPLERLFRGGYEITTTLNIDLQAQAACAVKRLMDSVQASQPIVPGGESRCETFTFLPSSLQPGNDAPGQGLGAEAIVLDPQSGEILAWVGGEDADPTPGLPAAHPASTILSPFLYLTAFTRGISPATLLWDLPAFDGKPVSDDVMRSYHGPVSARAALVNDYSGASAQLLEQVGLENVWKTEKSFGIIPDQVTSSSAPSIDILNTQYISLITGSQAYGVLANQGIMAGHLSNKAGGNILNEIYPISVLKLDSLDGQVILDWSNTQVMPIVSKQLAYLATNVLSDGTVRQNDQGSPDLLDINRPAGVKTGISADGLNAWTIGYIPQLVVGTWLGSSTRSSGDLNAAMGAELWQAVMQYAAIHLPIQDFVMPDGISQVKVCVPSGLLATQLCPTSKDEVFIKGSEPSEKDNLYQEFSIDRQTGLLATIFTPSELVEKKVFLVLPPAESVWAIAFGLPAPPEGYDTIQVLPASSDQVRVTSPGMSGYVSGKVAIIGSAAGDNFSYYRLMVGKGLNPQQWTQIGEDVKQPVQDGFLGSWDTSGLDGPFILELQVVQGDQQIERDLSVVQVDNMAPLVQIIAPQAGQQFTAQSGGSIILQVKASDNQAVERVEFRLDDELVSTLYEPPYIILWPANAGVHQLHVVVYDPVGNKSEAGISFSVSK